MSSAHPATVDASTDAANDLKARLGPIIIGIDRNIHLRRIEKVLSWRIPSVAELADKYLGSHMTIVGSGPSAADTIERIPKGSFIVAVNGAHDWLVSRGIIPNIGILMDPAPWVQTYQTPRQGVTYIVGTTCHPKVWERFLAAGITPYAVCPVLAEGDHDLIMDRFPGSNFQFVTGGVTTGLRAVHMTSSLGAAMLDMHGFDSCYAPKKRHTASQLYAHFKPNTQHDAREITVKRRGADESFTCQSAPSCSRLTGGHIKPARAEKASLPERIGRKVRKALNADAAKVSSGECAARDADLNIRVFGDGAIPWMAWKDGSKAGRFLHAEPERMYEKYLDVAHWDYHNDCENYGFGSTPGDILEKACQSKSLH